MNPSLATRDDLSWTELVDAVVGSSRALVAIAARSLAGRSDDVTLPQYRMLVLLSSRGPQRVIDLAQHLGVNPSTATRMCDRLERKELVYRQSVRADRRAIEVGATEAGRELVAAVMAHRRAEVERILAALPAEQCQQIAQGLRLFAEAAGDVPEREWSVGWRAELE